MSEILATPITTLGAASPAMTSQRIGDLFDRHHQRLYGLARRLSSDPEEAKDLVQEAFLRAARRPGSLPAEDNKAEAWLVRVVVNLCRDRYRRLAVRRRPEVVHNLVHPEPASPESQAVARASVQAALATLKPRRRAVIVLRELEGLPVAEVARLLRMNPGTVRWHHSSGRKQLARFFRFKHRPPLKEGERPCPSNHQKANSRSFYFAPTPSSTIQAEPVTECRDATRCAGSSAGESTKPLATALAGRECGGSLGHGPGCRLVAIGHRRVAASSVAAGRSDIDPRHPERENRDPGGRQRARDSQDPVRDTGRNPRRLGTQSEFPVVSSLTPQLEKTRKDHEMKRTKSQRLGIAIVALTLSGSGLIRAQDNRSPQETPDTRLVQINLLAASKTGSSELSDLPANTRKAIEDIKDFLPFKSYRILDTSLVRALVSPPDRGESAGQDVHDRT